MTEEMYIAVLLPLAFKPADICNLPDGVVLTTGLAGELLIQGTQPQPFTASVSQRRNSVEVTMCKDIALNPEQRSVAQFKDAANAFTYINSASNMPTQEKQTIRHWLQGQLEAHGLFEDHAKTVLDAVIKTMAPTFEEKRWEDTPQDYPPLMRSLIWFHARREALTWIDANAPEHWARPIFEQGTKE